MVGAGDRSNIIEIWWEGDEFILRISVGLRKCLKWGKQPILIGCLYYWSPSHFPCLVFVPCSASTRARVPEGGLGQGCVRTQGERLLPVLCSPSPFFWGLAGQAERLAGTWQPLAAELRCVKGFTVVELHLTPDRVWGWIPAPCSQLCTSRLAPQRGNASFSCPRALGPTDHSEPSLSKPQDPLCSPLSPPPNQGREEGWSEPPH